MPHSRSRNARTIAAAIFLLILSACSNGPKQAAAKPADPAPPPGPYVWKSAQMVGGGFVDGIVFHPTEKNLRYCRTDIGGAYRWDEPSKQWISILDWVPYKDTNLMGVESIALDPGDPNRVYLACGMYTNPRSPNAAILRSDDRGATFQRADLPFKMGGNEDGRGNGERLAIDPSNPDVLYFGSRNAGLWRSTDRAATWSKVESFPDVTESLGGRGAAPPPTTQPGGRRGRGGGQARSSGIVFVTFASPHIFVGVSLMGRPNFFQSSDNGATWQSVQDAPTNLRLSHGVLASNGTIYLSYGAAPGPSRMTDGAIWKFNPSSGQWTNITPDKPDPANRRTFGYGGVSVDAHNPSALIASTFGYPQGEEIFRSIDAGATWKPIFRGGGVYDYSGAPYVQHTPIHWLLDIQIDPCDPNHAMFTTGYGGWETFDLTNADAGQPTHWSVMSKGIEETVALELLSPPDGAHLISAIGDYGGFVHWDLDKPEPEGNFINPRFGNTTGVACASNNPNIIARVGQAAGGERQGNVGFSLDAGKTWQPAKISPQGGRGGSIAVNADGSHWIWTTAQSSYFTTDNGATWTRCQGLSNISRTIADPINPMKFYALALFDGKLFISADGGATFVSQPLALPGGLPQRGGDRGDNRGGQDHLYCTPGKEGDFWLPAYEGLYHSTDSGKTFIALPGPTEIHAFGFGKSAPNVTDPALYLVGTIQNQHAVYRSDDYGINWKRINDDQDQWGLILQVTGDPRIYGRVYIGTHGRGTFYGDPR